ncbi:MAG: hypothetical protein ACI84D_002690, partial [Thalassolituus oleivorans]
MPNPSRRSLTRFVERLDLAISRLEDHDRSFSRVRLGWFLTAVAVWIAAVQYSEGALEWLVPLVG